MKSFCSNQLPIYTLATLRLVCRAARDLVDGRCTRLRCKAGGAAVVRLHALFCGDKDIMPLLGTARRLRRLESLAAPAITCQRDCDNFVLFLSRLPGRGAALRQVRLDGVDCVLTHPGLLGVAIGALTGLQLLEVTVKSTPATSALPAGGQNVSAVLRALSAGVRATPAARLALHVCDVELDAGTRLAALLPFERLESLALDGKMLQFSATQLLTTEAAAALTALRSLDVCVSQGRPASHLVLPFVPWTPWPGSPFWAVCRAPWLGQLTRLCIQGPKVLFDGLARALAPASLSSLRDLSLAVANDWAPPLPSPPAVLDALLAACNPATLETLSLSGAGFADAAGLAERLPALASLTLAPVWQVLASARLAPLTSVSLSVDASWQLAEPGGLGAALSAPWAASLRAVTLGGPLCAPSGGAPLRPLAALSQLPHLRALRLRAPRLGAAELREAAAAAAAGGCSWVAKLAEFEVVDIDIGVDAARAWLWLLWSARRLERLAITANVSADERNELMAGVARALPAVSSVAWTAADVR